MSTHTIACEACGHRFDPHREARRDRCEHWRCAGCGNEHHSDDYPEVREQSRSSGGSSGSDGVTININVDDDGVNVL